MSLGHSGSSGPVGLGSPAAEARKGRFGTGTCVAEMGEKGEWGLEVEVRSFGRVSVLVLDWRA